MDRAPRLDRTVLVTHLLAGAWWCLLLAGLGSWPLALVASAYVVVASLAIAAVSGRAARSGRVAVGVRVATWLAAVGLWARVLGEIDGGGADDSVAPLVWAATLLGTLCWLAWQLLTLALQWVARRGAELRAQRSA